MANQGQGVAAGPQGPCCVQLLVPRPFATRWMHQPEMPRGAVAWGMVQRLALLPGASGCHAVHAARGAWGARQEKVVWIEELQEATQC